MEFDDDRFEVVFASLVFTSILSDEIQTRGPSMMRSRVPRLGARGAGGFTPLEVLLALVIIILLLATMTRRDGTANSISNSIVAPTPRISG